MARAAKVLALGLPRPLRLAGLAGVLASSAAASEALLCHRSSEIVVF
jgi:hypothetical protein